MIDKLPRRIRSKIRKSATGCWYWTGGRTDRGYGQLWWQGRNLGAHRVVYTLLVGEIPDGLELDHRCRVRHCVNPDDLEPVTGEMNRARGVVGRATDPDCVTKERARKRAYRRRRANP